MRFLRPSPAHGSRPYACPGHSQSRAWEMSATYRTFGKGLRVGEARRGSPTSRTRPAVHFLTLAGPGPIRPKRNHTKPLTHQTARQGGLSIHSAGSWKRLSSSTIFFSTRWDLPCRHHRAHTLPGAVQLLLHFPPASRHGSGGQDGTVSPSRCRCGTLPMWLHVATMVGCRRIPRPLRISVISSLSLICGAG